MTESQVQDLTEEQLDNLAKQFNRPNYLGLVGMMFLIVLFLSMMYWTVFIFTEDLAKSVEEIIGAYIK